jgi:thiol-disulfide isomerase/thioredoxin
MLDGIVEWTPSSQRWREPPSPPKPAKVTVLHLWSPRCAPCVAELPLLKRMVAAWRSEPAVRFLLVADFDEDGDGSELLSFLASQTAQGWPSPILRLRDGRLRESFGVMVQPLTLILDEQRVVRQVFVGPLAGRSVGSAVSRLLDVVR